MFCWRMIGAEALGSKSSFAAVVRQMLCSVTGAPMWRSSRLKNSWMSPSSTPSSLRLR
ncbi:hypothetical protein SCALM49S_07909 [Streptomyces californicus]